jgi:predicted nuclease with RNAse H fold
MISTDTLYIGIDPTSGKKEFGYAALDGNLNLITLADANMEELVAFLENQTSAFVAVNAPGRVNRGLVKNKRDEKNTSPGRTFRGVDVRLAEHELRERGIHVAGTPSREEYCPAWMQLGFALYQKLSDLEFKSLGAEGADRHVFETHPYACFCVLAESIPFPKPTMEGRLQRQSILFDKGLRIKDAMEFFEEITRFKLMKGILPTDKLYSPEQLDVLVAAYTAWVVANRPGEIANVGDKSEGQILLPVRELQNKY